MFKKTKKKRSFFEKLTGAVPADEFDFDDEEEEEENPFSRDNRRNTRSISSLEEENEIDQDEESLGSIMEETDGQLSVDVINTDDAIIIKAMLAGVKPNDIDIDIARDMVTVRGKREEEHESSKENYYHRELYWGSFSRNILLPEEIDVDEADATEKNGLVTLRLPKLDKTRKTKLHVKSR